MDKQSMRSLMKTLRNNLSQSEILQKSQTITGNLLALPQTVQASHILLYLPINNEVDTKILIGKLLAENKTLYLPYFDISLSKYLITAFDNISKFKIGPYGIRQPKASKTIPVAKIELAILPGLAFDKNGYRLGYGKGVYDQLLQNSKSTKIGLAYDFQLQKRIPHQTHDIKMDIIVTEKQVIKMRS